MEKIIASTDFSKTANNALNYAVMLAKGQKTPVALEMLHVYQGSEELSSSISLQHPNLSRQGLFDKIINKHSTDLPAHITLNGVMRKGPTTQTIVKEAKEGHADMIVMGRNGMNSLKDWLVGTTTIQVVNQTEIPVIAIPKKAKATPPKKIALAIDDRFVPSDKTLQPLFELIDKFNSELVLFHIEQEEAHSNTHKETAIKIARKGYQINLYKKDSHQIGEAIIDLAAEHRVDLVCVVRHDYTTWEKMLHKSIALDVIKNSPLPFLILHDSI